MTQSCATCRFGITISASTSHCAREVLDAALHHLIALQRFKAFVHQRLDEAGVPTHPDGPHSKQGCRIGDRLDIVLADAGCAQVAEDVTSAYERLSAAVRNLVAKLPPAAIEACRDELAALRGAALSIRGGSR